MIQSLIIILVGIVGALKNKKIVMKIISLDVMNTGIVLLFVSMTHRKNAFPPIVNLQSNMANFADPLPQAVIITAIVIGFSILALSTVLAGMLTERLKKGSVDEIERMMKD